MASPFDPRALRMLQLVTRGLEDSPAYRAIHGKSTMQRVAEMQDSPMLKLVRGDTAMQRFTEIQESPVMRAVRGDATWKMLTGGEPAVLAALRQPSLAQRLSQVVADATAARLDQALLLARATYEDVLYSAVDEGLESSSAPADSEGLLGEAEQQVATALQELDVDGRAAVQEAVDAARSDFSAALSAATQPPDGFVAVSLLAEQQETNRLLRELLAKKPQPDQVVRWATIVLVVIGILTLIVMLNPPAAATLWAGP